MRLYLVTSDATNYDEYDAVLIRAANPAAAEGIARMRDTGVVNKSCVTSAYGDNRRGFEPHRKVTVTEVTADGPEEIIIGCYHAG